jgi:hypothetical protein
LLRHLVRTYDQGSEAPLSAAEQALLPLAIARQPAWSTGGSVLRLGDADAVRHATTPQQTFPSVMRPFDAWLHALKWPGWVARVLPALRAAAGAISCLGGIIASVQRVVVLGRGGAGKSTAAVHLGQITGLPVIELDKHFWSSGLHPLSREEWARVTSDLAARPTWVMDGDLGPYDLLAPRLRRADTVLILDYGLLRCVWRAHRRSRERADFWRWMLTWRRRSRPVLLRAIG